MIYISAHKDFNLVNKIILDHPKEYSIIDDCELKNDYVIGVIHETSLNNKLYELHHIYGDMTRQYYIYKNLNLYMDDVIGFMQYRRMFNDNTLLNYREILRSYDAVVPCRWHIGNIIRQYNICHQGNLLSIALDLIYDKFEEYRSTIDTFRNTNFVIAHNMYIMKYKDFISYCRFMFSTLDLLSSTNIQQYERCYSFVAERLSTLFYMHHFKDRRLYHSDITIY